MNWLFGGGRSDSPSRTGRADRLQDALAVIDDACARAGLSRTYPNRGLLADQVGALAEGFPGLQPRHALYPGWQHPLICLDGTVPIAHGGAGYNIPVNLWIFPSFPHPLVGSIPPSPLALVVTPTPGMVLKPGHPSVDAAGRCSLSAIARWAPRGSTLSAVLAEACAAFSAVPPVYALPQGHVVQALPSGQAVAHGGVAQAQLAEHQPPQAPAQPPPQHSGRADTRELTRELAEGRREFIALRLRERAAELARESAAREAELARERAVLQERARHVIDVEAQCLAEAEAGEAHTLAASTYRARAEEWVAAHGMGSSAGQTEPGIEALVVPADARSEQLLAALSEERAVQEVLRTLAGLHEEGKVPTKLFLKQTRKLSRELFFARAARMEAVGETALTARPAR